MLIIAEVEVIGNLEVLLMLLACGAGPEVDAAQFAQIVKQQSATLKSVVFVYEGRTRWIGPGNLGITPEKFDGEFQGTFLYRADGAAVVDTYFKKSNQKSSVVRKKKSVLNGVTESIRGALDAKVPVNPARDIRFGKGSVGTMTDVAPLEFFWTWYWAEWSDLRRRNYIYQGWERVDGHDCLRFRIDRGGDDEFRKQNYQLFWVDVERCANVVRFENYANNQMTVKNDITLLSLIGDDGKFYWVPSHGHIGWYAWEDKVYNDPVSEQITDIVNGSARVNIDLPNSLFTVRRDFALPAAGELENLRRDSGSSSLRQEFEAQPASQPFRTDPTSIHRRIDQNLAEADRQSKELAASSPARASWSWTTALQSALVLIGVALLGGVTYRKWSRG